MIINHAPRDPTIIFKYRERLIAEGLMWNGHRFQIDMFSQGLIGNRILKIVTSQIANEPLPNFEWRTMANGMYEFTASEFIEFGKAVDARVEEVMRLSWNIKDGLV